MLTYTRTTTASATSPKTSSANFWFWFIGSLATAFPPSRLTVLTPPQPRDERDQHHRVFAHSNVYPGPTFFPG